MLALEELNTILDEIKNKHFPKGNVVLKELLEEYFKLIKAKASIVEQKHILDLCQKASEK